MWGNGSILLLTVTCRPPDPRKFTQVANWSLAGRIFDQNLKFEVRISSLYLNRSAVSLINWSRLTLVEWCSKTTADWLTSVGWASRPVWRRGRSGPRHRWRRAPGWSTWRRTGSSRWGGSPSEARPRGRQRRRGWGLPANHIQPCK